MLHDTRRTIEPGGTIGIIGGGHMGRLAALAARSLGYRVRVLAPEGDAACDGVADQVLHGDLADADLAALLARDCDVVTAVAEHVAPAALDAAAAFAPVRPDGVLVGIAQDRAREREWLASRGLQLGPWREARDEARLQRALAELEAPCYVKPRLRAGEAARPLLVTSEAEATAAWHALGRRPCVVEAALAIDLELCVLVARTPDGAVVAYPPAHGCRVHAELLWSALPGELPARVAEKARGLATYVAGKLGLEGLLAVEMFLLRDGRLVVNELVPGPHDTYHVAEAACETAQSEQLVRAVCGLPLGATDVRRSAAVSYVTGEMWDHGSGPVFDRALHVPGVRLHLYGHAEPRRWRKMGHLVATGDSSEDAVERVLLARRHVALRGRGTRRVGTTTR